MRASARDLRDLEAAGVLTRTVFPTVPPRVEYALTESGRRLERLLDQLGDWWEESRKLQPAVSAGVK